jgi:CHAT domain-containing protein/Flp pilus assembly protein TadD
MGFSSLFEILPMCHYLKYLIFATVLFPLLGLSVSVQLSSPITAQTQTTQQSSAEALQLLDIAIQQYENGSLQEALQTFQKVVAIVRLNGDQKLEAVVLNVMGRIYVDLGKDSQALETFQQALTLARKNGIKVGESSVLHSIGMIYQNRGQSTKALELYQQALTISKQINDTLGQGIILNNIGRIYFNWGDYTKAFDYFQQALASHQKIANKRDEVTTLNNIGNIYTGWAEYNKALEAYNQALVISKSIGDKIGQSSSLNNIGLTYNQTGDYTKALEYHQQALVLIKQIGNTTGEITTLNSIGLAYSKQGQYTKALEAYQQALVIVQQVSNQGLAAITINNIGDVYRSLGDYAKALEFFQQALAINKQIDDKAGKSTSLNNIAFIYNNQGQYVKALNYYEQALEVRQKINQKALIGESLNNIGAVYTNLGQYEQALKFYQQSLTVAAAIDNKAGEGKVLHNIGSIYNLKKDYAKALFYYEQALNTLQKINDKAGANTTLNNIGQIYGKQEEYAKALNILQKSLTLAQEIGDKTGVGASLNNIGAVYYSQKQYVKALELHQQALAIAKQVGSKAQEGTSLNNIGSTYTNLGQYENAEKTLYTAIEIWEDLRRNELSDAQKISIFETQAETYRLLQQSLIAQNKINSALEVSDRAKARAFVELLASKQLDKANPQLNIKPLTIQQIQNIAKTQNATLVQYSIIGDQKLYIWVIQPTGEIAFTQVDLQKSLKTSLQELVSISRKSIGVSQRGITVKPAPGTNQTKQLQKLHEILIEPIAKHLPKDPQARVIFIPQESLFLVPFPALQDEQGNYLIEKHTILTAPAIQVLDLTRKQKVGKQSGEVLVVGNPTMPTIPTTNEQLQPLTGAEKEAIEIADLFKTQAIIGSKATKSAILPRMKQARIIHFATHGLLDDFKGFGVPGAIALAPSGQDDGFLTAGEILDMKLNAELVVLSACDTGRGTITGDGVIGLSRSLITAGVPSVIVSLWSVNDNSTAFLMSEFYRHLQQNPDKALALRQAMLATKQKYNHPFDWAAFTLIGEVN